LRVDGVRLSPVRLRATVRLGDPVWVIAFPWGRRSTVVSGVVSQLAAEGGDSALEGAVSMVDASVSYGASGGGVFDAQTGELIGLVESHRTARVTMPEARDRSLEIPVPGETTVVSVVAIRTFLSKTTLPNLLQR
jgi:S1-C subfamily serine protease